VLRASPRAANLVIGRWRLSCLTHASGGATQWTMTGTGIAWRVTPRGDARDIGGLLAQYRIGPASGARDERRVGGHDRARRTLPPRNGFWSDRLLSDRPVL